jgi:hypothetical protein
MTMTSPSNWPKYDTRPNGPKLDQGDPEPTVLDHVMIDIETMSLHPHKALILSVGMIEFDPTQLDSLKIGKRELLVLEIAPQLLKCRRVDRGTQKFWAEQSAAASAHWRDATEHYHPVDAIDHIKQFCRDKKCVWANGTQFDLSNLIGLAEDFGDEEPLWHYRAPRDMRTFVKETPATKLLPASDALDIPGTAHDPIYDCIVQTWQVWAHWQS